MRNCSWLGELLLVLVLLCRRSKGVFLGGLEATGRVNGHRLDCILDLALRHHMCFAASCSFSEHWWGDDGLEDLISVQCHHHPRLSCLDDGLLLTLHLLNNV